MLGAARDLLAGVEEYTHSIIGHMWVMLILCAIVSLVVLSVSASGQDENFENWSNGLAEHVDSTTEQD